ncbi:dnaJ-related protein Scj1p [[Candida] anglica]|uniref:DnaJ-related protein Scj1p n=1 Tax=[Candida] anglica TaxID=148631 RepID=A0ABP0EM32_9ASCO
MKSIFVALSVLAYLLFAVVVEAAPDYYSILGINKRANEKEIKTAYRQLSKQYHPDKNSSPEAHDKFVEVGEAYEVLSNKEKRANYDKYGDPEGPQHHGGPGDFFNNMFGGHHGGQHGGQQRGDNSQLNLNLALSDFFQGKDMDFEVEMVNICTDCTGSGSSDGKKIKCKNCNGGGVVMIRRQLAPGFVQTFQSQCDQCQGKGSIVANPCKVCSGSGAKRGKRKYDVHIPAGFPRDGVQTMEGEGDAYPDIIPGDLHIVFKEDLSRSWGYRRVGNNLYRDEVLTAKEALGGGWERHIPYFDEIETEIKLSRNAQQMVRDGEIEVVQGKGMPFHNADGLDDDKHGDLFIQYKIVIPGGSKEAAGHVMRDEL